MFDNNLGIIKDETCLQCFDAVGWAAGRASGLLKTERWGAGVVVCLERDAGLHIAQLMPLPLTDSCFSKIQIGFTFLVPAHPGSPGQRAAKRVCVKTGWAADSVSKYKLYFSLLCKNTPGRARSPKRDTFGIIAACIAVFIARMPFLSCHFSCLKPF